MLETVIIGAGPYGLSLAAHFRQRGIPFRIFGRVMDSWISKMPKGMMLKSDGFASDIYDPRSEFTLKHFCAERGIKYADTGVPVKLDTVTAYGTEFKDRLVPELEDKMVVSIDRLPDGFSLKLDTGETFTTRKVVLAIGITHFQFIPSTLSNLSPEYLSHSAQHSDLEPFRGRNVAVIGGGSSALDLAGLMQEAGVNVQLIARRTELKFHSGPMDKPRSWWHKLRHPNSGLGPGVRSRFYANAPWAFYYLPEGLRLKIVRRALGPSGGWFIKEKVIGKLPIFLGQTPERAEVKNGKVHLQLVGLDGAKQEVITDHVVAATGYKVDIDRLKFLSPEIRSNLKEVNKTPLLSSAFESSVPGLYFAGVSAANAFGPVMRFAFGAGFAARTIAQALAKSVSHAIATNPVARVATTVK